MSRIAPPAVRLAALFLLYLFLVACNGSGSVGGGVSGGGSGGNTGTTTGGGGTSTTNVTTQPAVLALSVDGGLDRAFLNSSVAVFFSEEIDAATLSSASFSISTGGNPVDGTIASDGTSAVFRPTVPLQPATKYTASLSSSVRARTGRSLTPFVSVFTTGSGSDTVPPAVIATDPSSGSVDVRTGAIIVSFSKSMDPTTLTPSTVLINGPGGAVPSTVTRTTAAVVVAPTIPLAASTTYTVTVTTLAKDLALNALPANFSFSFTTAAATAPEVLRVASVSPGENAVGVPLDTQVQAIFNEAMDQTTVTGSSFTLTGPGGIVPATIHADGAIVTLTPTTQLLPLTLYQGMIAAGVKDAAGVGLALAKAWSFTTGGAAVTSGPRIVTVTPPNGSTGVVLAPPAISATFDVPIDAASVSSSSFFLSLTGIPVSGTVSASGTTIRFTPLIPLLGNTTYTATITSAIRDTNGNFFAGPLSWTFKTGLF